MVVRDVPQCHRDGRRRRAQLAVRHGSSGMGPRDRGAAGGVVHHPVHAAPSHRDARVRPRRAVRPVPRPGRARPRPAPRPLGGRPAAAHRAGRLRRSVHGHRRQLPAEVRAVRVPVLHAAAPVLLDLHLRLLPVPALPAPRPQLHHRHLPRRRRHVAQLLHHILGGVPRQGPRGRGELRVQSGGHGSGLGVPGVRRARAGGVRVRRARRGAGDPGHHPVHADQAVQGAHVEGHRRRVHGHRRVLLPRGVHRVLGVRPRRQRQRARGARAPALARRGGQHDGGRPCPRELPGVRHADIREHRDNSDHQVQGSSRGSPPPGGSINLRCVDAVRRRHVPLLRRPPRLLRRLRLHAHVLLPSLHPVAEHQETPEVQRVVVRQLGVHRPWCAADACVHHRRVKEHHPGRIHVPVLLLNDQLTALAACKIDGCQTNGVPTQTQ